MSAGLSFVAAPSSCLSSERDDNVAVCVRWCEASPLSCCRHCRLAGFGDDPSPGLRLKASSSSSMPTHSGDDATSSAAELESRPTDAVTSDGRLGFCWWWSCCYNITISQSVNIMIRNEQNIKKSGKRANTLFTKKGISIFYFCSLSCWTGTNSCNKFSNTSKSAYRQCLPG